MSALLESISEFEARESCRVIVLYDSAVTREKALRFCDHLMRQFGEDLNFAFEWWRTDFLAEIPLAEISAAQAKDADVFIICINPGEQLAPPVKQWFDSWADKHAGRPGALVDLNARPADQPGWDWATHQFLREISKIATLDFLEPAGSSPVVIQAFPLRMLNDPPAPEHYGLNE